MKRSEINKAIQHSLRVLKKNNTLLPFFAYWTTNEWKQNKKRIGTLSKVMQGWDVTDFGSGRFSEVGAVLFTIRNGDVNDPGIGTPYAEKVIILQHKKEQKIPMHHHLMKAEDIINRGGGILCIQMYNVSPEGGIDYKTDISVFMDGIYQSFKAGEIVEIQPGDSITLTPNLYHSFWAKKGAGDLVVGEVSSINDDKKDNVFSEPAGMFNEIEEDDPMYLPLVNEYNKL
jgi:D-lyxose ketol-isomerase